MDLFARANNMYYLMMLLLLHIVFLHTKNTSLIMMIMMHCHICNLHSCSNADLISKEGKLKFD